MRSKRTGAVGQNNGSVTSRRPAVWNRLVRGHLVDVSLVERVMVQEPRGIEARGWGVVIVGEGVELRVGKVACVHSQVFEHATDKDGR